MDTNQTSELLRLILSRDNNKDIPRKEELGYVVDRVSKSTLEGGRDK